MTLRRGGCGESAGDMFLCITLLTGTLCVSTERKTNPVLHESLINESYLMVFCIHSYLPRSSVHLISEGGEIAKDMARITILHRACSFPECYHQVWLFPNDSAFNNTLVPIAICSLNNNHCHGNKLRLENKRVPCTALMMQNRIRKKHHCRLPQVPCFAYKTWGVIPSISMLWIIDSGMGQ